MGSSQGLSSARAAEPVGAFCCSCGSGDADEAGDAGHAAAAGDAEDAEDAGDAAAAPGAAAALGPHLAGMKAPLLPGPARTQ